MLGVRDESGLCPALAGQTDLSFRFLRATVGMLRDSGSQSRKQSCGERSRVRDFLEEVRIY